MAGTMKQNPVGRAVDDLGLGAQVKQDLADDLEERRKKMLNASRLSGIPGMASAALLGQVGNVNY